MPTTIITITREIDVEVTYTHHRGYPGSFIDPPEPEYNEIESAKVIGPEGKFSVDIELTESELEEAEEKCAADSQDRYDAAMEDRADRQREDF